MKKYPLILWSILLITTPILATTEDLPELMRRDVMLRPYVKDLITSSNVKEQSRILASIESSVSFSQLDFRELIPKVFRGNVWIPSSYDFRNSVLQELFRPYCPRLSPTEVHMIFVANVLYDAGSRLYQQTGNFSHLEHAASIGHAGAQRKMFTLYFKINKLEEAKNSLLCCAAQGDPEALLTLSSVYQGCWGAMVERNVDTARTLCQKASELGNTKALFDIRVATLTEGLFNSERNYQQGIRVAKELADAGNEPAQAFLRSIMKSSGDALQEGNDFITDEDLDFLKVFLGWKDWDD